MKRTGLNRDGSSKKRNPGRRNSWKSSEAPRVMLTCWILLFSWLCLRRLSSSLGSPASRQKEYKGTESLQLDRRLLRTRSAGRMREAPSSMPFRIWVKGGGIAVIRGKRRVTVTKCPQGVGISPDVAIPFSGSLKHREGEEGNRETVPGKRITDGHVSWLITAVNKKEGTTPQDLSVRPNAIPACSLPSPALHLKNKTKQTHAHSCTHFWKWKTMDTKPCYSTPDRQNNIIQL